jgi:predicted permease
MVLDGFRKLVVLNPGFRTDHLMTVELDTSLVRYTPAQTRDFYRKLVDRARALPGVRSVALTGTIPFSPVQTPEAVIPEGHQFPQGRVSVTLFGDVVSEAYFDTMKTDIMRGRGFTADDRDGSRQVAVVNEEFAKTYWPGRDPIGKRLRLNDSRSPWLEVVGVARTGKYVSIAESPRPFLYLPFAQHPGTRMTLLVETHGDPAAAAAPLRDVVRALDPNQPVYNVRTLSSFYDHRAVAVPRMIVQMVGSMGMLGLTLAMIGLCGLVAYSVARRTREIGVRMAIGANKGDVLKMVLRQGLTLSVAGIVLGGLASVAVARLLTAALAGLGAPNPATYVIVPVLLILLTMAGCYIPARRASLVDPITALRCE